MRLLSESSSLLYLLVALGLFFGMEQLLGKSSELGSIRINAKFEIDQSSLDLVVVKKGQNQIRATIPSRLNSNDRIVFLLRDGEIKKFEGNPESMRVLALERKEQVTSLFDLLALNPDYHFQRRGGFNLQTSLLHGYRIELVREPFALDITRQRHPMELQLWSAPENGVSKCIRTIRYQSFHQATGPFSQPKEMAFSNADGSEKGNIIVESVEYNVGLPDFLFQIEP